MPATESELGSKLTKMLHRILDAPEQTATTIAKLCESNGLHVTDLGVAVRGRAGLLAEVEALREQNAFLRRFAPKRWDEFLEAAAAKLHCSGRGGLALLAETLGCKVEYLADCRHQGLVPWTLVEKLAGLEDRPPPGRAERLDRRLRDFVARVAASGLPPAEIEEMLTLVGERRIKASQVRRALLSLAEEVRPFDSPHPLTAAEVEAMMALWPTRRESRLAVFAETHLGRKCNLLHECDQLRAGERRRLRRAYWAEVRMRDRDEGYRRLSAGMADIHRSFGTATEEGSEAWLLARDLLGEKPLEGLAALTGLARSQLAQMAGTGVAPEGLIAFLRQALVSLRRTATKDDQSQTRENA
jgi:hypothetical protein